MKFDYATFNPPYQDSTIGDNEAFAPPVYDKFMDAAFGVSDTVVTIHPARFLFNAGRTPSDWNKKMLNDEHFKVLYYEPNSSKIFSGTSIMGGIAISYRSNNTTFTPIEIFTPFKELNSIKNKVKLKEESEKLTSIIFIQNKFDLDELYADYPEYKEIIGSNGKDKRFRNNAFSKLEIFTENCTDEESYSVRGLFKNKRVNRFIPKKYVDRHHENIDKWKVLIPRSNGSGAIGEVKKTPLIGIPEIAPPETLYTQTFISVGAFDSEDEAKNAIRYIKSKFARTMLGILKITQDNNRDKWELVPIQDFTDNSDIDWSKSIPEIDQQLYRKYGLSDEEIAFIEEKVQAME